MNQQIANLKILQSERDNPRYHYKVQAIDGFAADLAGCLAGSRLLEKEPTFVAVPPSLGRNHPEHDDRMMRILHGLSDRLGGLDVRELIIQNESMDPVHLEDGRRPPPAVLAENYSINDEIKQPAPVYIVVLDDVLTTGSHYKGVRMRLKEEFGNIPVIRIFLARRVFIEEEGP